MIGDINVRVRKEGIFSLTVRNFSPHYNTSDNEDWLIAFAVISIDISANSHRCPLMKEPRKKLIML